MDLQSLTQEMHRFVRAKGWYGPTSSRPQTLRNLAISLNIEAAEVLELFQWDDKLESQQALANELADVALYLLQLASLAEINLEQAILAKLEYNYSRQWNQPDSPEIENSDDSAELKSS